MVANMLLLLAEMVMAFRKDGATVGKVLSQMVDRANQVAITMLEIGLVMITNLKKAKWNDGKVGLGELYKLLILILLFVHGGSIMYALTHPLVKAHTKSLMIPHYVASKKMAIFRFWGAC